MNYIFIIFTASVALILSSCQEGYNTINEDRNLKTNSIDISSRSEKIYPVAKINGLSGSVNLGDLVFADGVSSSDSDGWITGYSWSLNDKNISRSSKQVFEFDTIGKQTICLSVTDNDNLTTTTCKSVLVNGLPTLNQEKKPPVAKFSISTTDNELHPYIPYTLDCSKSYDQDENNKSIISCDWSQSDAYWYYGYDKITDPPNCAKLTKINKTQTILEICDAAAKVEIVLSVTDNEGDTNTTSKIYYIKDWY